MARKRTGRPPGRPKADRTVALLTCSYGHDGLPQYQMNAPASQLAMAYHNARLIVDGMPKRAIRKNLAHQFPDARGNPKSQASISKIFRDQRYYNRVEIEIAGLNLEIASRDADPVAYTKYQADLRADIAAAIDEVERGIGGKLGD